MVNSIGFPFQHFGHLGAYYWTNQLERGVVLLHPGNDWIEVTSSFSNKGRLLFDGHERFKLLEVLVGSTQTPAGKYHVN
jgi:hypothetical protein